MGQSTIIPAGGLLERHAQSVDRRLELPEAKPILRAGILPWPASEGGQLPSNVEIRLVNALHRGVHSIDELVPGGFFGHSDCS